MTVRGLNPTIEVKKCTVTYADSIAGTGTVTLFTLPTNSKILLGWAKTTTAFTNGSNSDFQLAVGITGSTSAVFSAYDLDAAVADANVKEGTGVCVGGVGNVAVLATITGTSIATFSAGSVDIYLLVAHFPISNL